MRHLKAGKKLGRTASHRKATIQALSVSLIKHHRIVTTLARAKELRRFVEPVITRAKEDTPHHRRLAFAFLRDKEAVTHLFEEVGTLVADRPGGYTRVIKLAPRQRDGAEIAMIELVDYNDVKPEGDKATRKRTRRGGGRSRSKKKSAVEPVPSKAETQPKPEEKQEEAEDGKEKVKAEDTADAGVAETEAAEAAEDTEGQKEKSEEKKTKAKKETKSEEKKEKPSDEK